MARQDIYATLGDDILGERCGTSSTKGKVKCINVWVNTDVAGDANLTFCFLKDKNTVEISGDMPKEWIKSIREK